jgi:hydroxypyruvate reductase
MTIVLARMPLAPHLQKRLSDRYEIQTHGLRQPIAEIPAELRDRIDVVFTAGNIVHGAADMDVTPNLRLIACFGSGFEGVDVAAARARGIAVTNCTNTNHECVADMAWALLLAAGRHVVPADIFTRAGKWAVGEPGYPRMFKTVHGSKLGILGLGAIGTAVARRAQGFNMEIAWCGRNPQPTVPWRHVRDVEELAAWSDYLVVSLRAGEDNRHIVNERVMRALGPEGTLVNVARGSVVDEAAMARGLKEGWLGAAALDVYEDEPRIHPGLLAQPNAVLSPHMGGWTWYSFEKQLDLVMENIAAIRAGRPPLTPVPG